MIFFGGVVGFALGMILLATTFGILGLVIPPVLAPVLAALAPFFALLAPIVGPLFGPLTGPTWFVVAVFSAGLVTLLAYVLAVIGLLPLLVPPAGRVAISALEDFMRGFIIGFTAALNLTILTLIASPGLGVVVTVVGLLAVFPPISRNAVYQAVLGWLSWLMPMSYLATFLGFILFVLNLPFAIMAFGAGAVRLDLTTGTIESTGGVVGVTGFVGGGFNLGNFTFLSPGPGVGLAIQTPFGVPGLSAHETGHTLNVAALGGLYHWIGAIEQNVPPFARGPLAHGELTAESHLPRPGMFFVGIWS
jgi:hypothetical protein